MLFDIFVINSQKNGCTSMSLSKARPFSVGFATRHYRLQFSMCVCLHVVWRLSFMMTEKENKVESEGSKVGYVMMMVTCGGLFPHGNLLVFVSSACRKSVNNR